MVLADYKIFNAEVLFRGDYTIDQFIDIVVGNRIYMTCLFVFNKIDQISLEEVDRIARTPNSGKFICVLLNENFLLVVISCKDKLNLEYLKDCIWDKLQMIRVFTKKPGDKPDLRDEEGIILRGGSTVEHCCHAVHRTLKADFKYALVWGTSAKHSPQRVGLRQSFKSGN